jgi:alkylation response protein AidB-like acyl-CoA dehydrogenase
MASDFLRAARELRQVIDRNAAADDGRPMSRKSVDALAAAGLFGVMTPRAVGGSELPLLDVLDIFAEVARADGSAGWCLMAGASAVAYFGAYCPDEFVERAFASGVPLAAGQFFPNGTALRDGDGYRIRGNYQFGSGINHAESVAVGAFTAPPEGSSEAPEMICALLPIDRAEIKGNWEVLGLQSTASYDYDVIDVHVPMSSTFKLLSPTRYRGGAIYELGVLPLTAVGHAGFAIGVVRRALDELVTIAKSKHRMGAPSPLSDSEYFLQRLGTLEGRFRAAVAWVRESFARLERTAIETGKCDPIGANEVRQATVHVTQDGADIVQGAYRLAGTSGLRKGPLERCFRDIHAGSQHFFASPTPTLDFARDLMATAPASAIEAA